MMRKLIAVVVLLLAATTAFAHAGHHHKYLGTITAIHGDEVSLHTTDAHDVTFTIASTTSFMRGDAAASRSDVTVGTRVSVEMALDGKTAMVVKVGATSH